MWVVTAVMLASCGAERPERETVRVVPEARTEIAQNDHPAPAPPPLASHDAGAPAEAPAAGDAGVDAGDPREPMETTRTPTPRLPRAHVVQIVLPDGTLRGDPRAPEACQRVVSGIRGVTVVRSAADIDRVLGSDPRCFGDVRRVLRRAVAAGQHVLTAAYNYPATARVVPGRSPPAIRVRTRASGVNPGDAVWLVVAYYDPADGELQLEHGPTGCEQCR